MSPLTEQMVAHDLDDTTALLEITKGLSEEELLAIRQPGLVVLSWEGPEESIATVLEHQVFAKEVWLAAIEGLDMPPRDDVPDATRLLERHAAVAPRWLETVRDINRRGAWNDRLIDALCDPPESFVMSSVIAHVLTFAAHRRQLVRHMLTLAGRTVDHGDPIMWLRPARGALMSVTTYYTATSLDGFIADEQHSLEWLFRQDQDESGRSTTYEWVLDHEKGRWPYQLPTWVMTTRDLPKVGGLRFAGGDVRSVHAEMTAAAGGKDLWVVGGGDLAGQFADAGLLDEIIVYVAAVTLGGGAALLPRKLDLQLEELARNKSFACARYSVVGPAGMVENGSGGVTMGQADA